MTETDFRRIEPTTEEAALFRVEDALSERAQAIVEAGGWYASMTASKYVSEDTLEYAEDEFKRDLAAELGEQEAELTDDDRAALLEWCERAEDAAESAGYRTVGVIASAAFTTTTRIMCGVL
jgi:hypothetical protein